MKIRAMLLSCVALLMFSSQVIFSAKAAEIRYVGGDISLLPKYINAGAIYKDDQGNKIELLPYLHELGMNAMRVRLFVDPAAYPGVDKDENACQDLPYILPLCKDIVDNGFDLMLDFHYSDTWADPGKQWIPEAWKDLTDAELEEQVYDYTLETLTTLKENGIVPKFIQPGNEISYGMLWAPYGHDIPGNHVYINSSTATWERFGRFLASAIRACREVCPEAEIIIHTERAQQVSILTNFYDKMKVLDIDYDIIGLSYYPYYHGDMSVLNNALTTLEARYPEKPIMIVETGFPYAWEVPGTNQDVDYDYSLVGQDVFAAELVETLLNHPNVNGLFWWWLEYNAYGSSLREDWYNAPLFDSRTGKATPALKTICSFGTAGVESIEADFENGSDNWYTIQGYKITGPDAPGIYIHNKKKVIIK